eukprot:GHVS01035817.1.p1 GENE.GHVS01035817.1~~GHVS01035817.1.p1  ORF type:complete len:551 (+),score=50.33 GHVS01035817.1:60-1712(+)
MRVSGKLAWRLLLLLVVVLEVSHRAVASGQALRRLGQALRRPMKTSTNGTSTNGASGKRDGPVTVDSGKDGKPVDGGNGSDSKSVVSQAGGEKDGDKGKDDAKDGNDRKPVDEENDSDRKHEVSQGDGGEKHGVDVSRAEDETRLSCGNESCDTGASANGAIVYKEGPAAADSGNGDKPVDKGNDPESESGSQGDESDSSGSSDDFDTQFQRRREKLNKAYLNFEEALKDENTSKIPNTFTQEYYKDSTDMLSKLGEYAKSRDELIEEVKYVGSRDMLNKLSKYVKSTDMLSKLGECMRNLGIYVGSTETVTGSFDPLMKDYDENKKAYIDYLGTIKQTVAKIVQELKGSERSAYSAKLKKINKAIEKAFRIESKYARNGPWKVINGAVEDQTIAEWTAAYLDRIEKQLKPQFEQFAKGFKTTLSESLIREYVSIGRCLPGKLQLLLSSAIRLFAKLSSNANYSKDLLDRCGTDWKALADSVTKLSKYACTVEEHLVDEDEPLADAFKTLRVTVAGFQYFNNGAVSYNLELLEDFVYIFLEMTRRGMSTP